VQRDRAGNHGTERDDQAARVVTGNIVVARVRDEIIGNNVDRAVRQHGRRRGGGDHHCDQRARNHGHCCVASGLLPPRPPSNAGRLGALRQAFRKALP
jgi:hypothetical protein